MTTRPGEPTMYRLAAALLASLSLAAVAAAQEPATVLENHRFAPDRIEVPAGKKVKLTIENRDAAPEEFDSGDLRIEKVIPGKSKGVVWLGPLKPGEYKFIGEYNEKTAHGVVVAK
jgi:plastocyanin domain-containing protein